MRLINKLSLFAAVFFIANSAVAQLCQGSLGDPIVNITFGAGPNPGSPLTAATTSYQYVANDCPNDGFYTVRNNTTNCFNNSWFSVTADHTGGGNGYFMLVNASVQPSAFYLDTVKGLCSNTTYEFAAWVLNVLQASACNSNGNQPNLTFTIEKTDGTILQSYNTGNISNGFSPVWRQYGFFFATPPGVVDVVLRIYNNAPGGCGNDLALDDITFRPCGPLVSASIAGTPSLTDTLCQGTSRSYTFTSTVSPGFSNPAYQWEESFNGSAWTDIAGATFVNYNKSFTANSATGTYSYRLTAAENGNIGSAKCRVSSQALTISLAPKPMVTYTQTSPVCEGGSWQLLLSSAETNYLFAMSGPQGRNWNGTCCGNSFPVGIDTLKLTDAGAYYITNTSSFGCVLYDTVNLLVNARPIAQTSFAAVSICAGKSVQLSGSGGISYKWIPANDLSSATIANPVANPADTTLYKLVVYNQAGCSDTTAVKVNVAERPLANAGPDKTIFAGGSVQLAGSVSGQDISYAWLPASTLNNPLLLRPTVNPLQDADYTLNVISNAGCGSASDKVHVYVYKDFYIPNAFSPNNDGINDTWNIPAINAFPEYEVTIYNRYGQAVYHVVNNFIPWDGSFKNIPQAAGAYVYVIKIKEDYRLYKGSLLMIR